jgi:flagellar protein FlaH
MAHPVLVIESDDQVLSLARSTLEEEGYEVVTATNGHRGLEMAEEEAPHLVILSMTLPRMDGGEVVRRLRTEPATSHIPIIMMMAEDEFEDLLVGHDLWVDDYLIKPFDGAELVAKARPLIKSGDRKKDVVSSGNDELDGKMGGGIPVGSLTLIEGNSGAGKSVLAQQIVWGSLQDGFTSTLFTSEDTVKSLVRQMRSLDLDILDFLLLGKCRVYPMELSSLGRQALSALLEAMGTESGHDMLIVDSLTSAIAHSSIEEVLGYFERCKQICTRGTTIIVVLHAHAVDGELLVRIRSMCDAHLQLRVEKDGQSLVKILEVAKVRGALSKTGNVVSFEVEPGWGMRVVPISKARG